jgi:hypothetical protein
MALKDYIFIGAAWVESALRYANLVGALVAAAVDGATGEALADEYTLTLSAVAGGTGTVTVQTLSPNNPYNGRVAAGVALNGATTYKNIVPGAVLTFTAGQANGAQSVVKVGQYLGTFDAFGAGAGVPSAATRHRVVNDGTGAVSDAVARLLTQAVMYKQIGSALLFVKPFADGATEKLNPGSTRTEPYNLTIVNVAGAGAGKTADLRIDGAAFGAASILNVATGALTDSVGLKAVAGGWTYVVVTGPLTGLEFSLDAACANGDEANVLVFPSRYVQIAADDGAGAPVAWGTANIVLTQAGQAAGVIQPGGEAFYHARILVPISSGALSNPHPASVALSGTETGGANWGG